ncbi:MAG TPA: ATP-binding protein [Kiritimatiellia bacterium]|nr:ATP-binding protein [Kiritimatiellia bacterium]HNS81336.1 ATP-binding protein [Kiritimatiellia bacterium]HPA77099.1 ATP-binding protein [Kiritimatiellia bacterium]HQQ03343.1 ATP-binding protein [Kiritimatiellia bacterium]
MNDVPLYRLSVISKGARAQFAIGVSLISILPLLMVGYLYTFFRNEATLYSVQTLAVLTTATLVGLTGFIILRKYPINIIRLREYLEQMIRGELPDQISLVKEEDDIQMVEKCLNMILLQLHERLEILKTEKQKLQNQIYQLQKMESLGVMAAGVAHDFNNLLTGISGLTKLMNGHIRDAEAQSRLKEIESLVSRASELTRQMLVYAGRGRFALEKVDAGGLVKDMAHLLNSTVARGVTTQYEAAETPTVVRADPTQLRQVIMNLVINASDAMEGRGGTIQVRTSCVRLRREDLLNCIVHGTAPAGNAACIEVVDQGPGIPADQMPRIFDPFFSSKPKGRGLGLAVVLGIVHSHKGAVVVDSEAGRGARFRVLLPLAEEAGIGS